MAHVPVVVTTIQEVRKAAVVVVLSTTTARAVGELVLSQIVQLVIPV